MRCETCSYWQPTEESDGGCKFYPPQLTQWTDAANISHTISLFPQTDSSDWCGQWHPIGTPLPNGYTIPAMRPKTAEMEEFTKKLRRITPKTRG